MARVEISSTRLSVRRMEAELKTHPSRGRMSEGTGTCCSTRNRRAEHRGRGPVGTPTRKPLPSHDPRRVSFSVRSRERCVWMIALIRRDGRRWTYTGTAFNTTVHYTDGTVEYTRRERPHLIFGDPAHPKRPTHLTSGVEYGAEHAADMCVRLKTKLICAVLGDVRRAVRRVLDSDPADWGEITAGRHRGRGLAAAPLLPASCCVAVDDGTSPHAR